jgi:N-acetylneuraminate lyase
MCGSGTNGVRKVSFEAATGSIRTPHDMMHSPLRGLIAATFSPLKQDGDIDLDRIGPMTEWLIEAGIAGLYVCGSTGEGMSLTTDERQRLTEQFVNATAKRVPVIVQVGHNSLAEARSLAAHAAAIGADVISATCPSYFKVHSVATLVDCMAEVAAGAPELPFYYYHIPSLTGSTLDMVEFLRRGGDRIPNLKGLKYTDTKLHEYLSCLRLDDGRFDVVWGCDEMLLGALATGAQGAIGSTYNIAPKLYQRLISAFEAGDLSQARELQAKSVQMIQAIVAYPFHAAMKAVLAWLGSPCGPCRLPQRELTAEESRQLRERLEVIGFFDWA